MDRYADHNRKILSPLDKVHVEKSEVGREKVVGRIVPFVESVAQTDVDKEATIVVVGSGDGQESEEKSKDNPSLVEHLTDLRKQLIKSLAVFLLFFLAVFSSINFWFPYMTRGNHLTILGPLEVVKFYMSISTALAFGLSLPFLCHFLWQFVRLGLNEKESGFLGLYSPVMLILFLVGIAFGYFVVNPLSYSFLITLGVVNFNVMVSTQEYVRFLLMTTIPIGVLFELPIVVLFLAAMSLLTSESMRNVRKWSYLGIAVVSALITPPDFVSQLIVLIPMVLLYEVSIFVAGFSERRHTQMN